MKKRILLGGMFALMSFSQVSATTPLSDEHRILREKVNLFMGTANDYGQMAPGATVPFGMVQVCPDSDPRQHPGYDYEVPLISGISINRLSGVGGSGCGGNVSLMPDAKGKDIRILKATEYAEPGYYETFLSASELDGYPSHGSGALCLPLNGGTRIAAQSHIFL